jgi:nicotinamidase/pyrazinamidase
MSEPPTRRALVIVDMSVEQMKAVSYKAEEVVKNCVKLAKHLSFFDVVIDCKLWLTNPEDSSLSWAWPETARTMFVAGSTGASLIPELREIPMTFIPKNNYSCFCKSRLLSKLQENNISHVYICGINTDFCVFATAMDSFQHQFKTFVIVDAVTSIRGKEAHQEGLRNLERHFSANVLISTQDTGILV